MNKKYLRYILYGIIFGAIVYLGMAFFTEEKLLVESIKKFNWSLLPILLILSLLNYFSRYLKWQYYINLLKVNISQKDSAAIFFSGLVMSISPAKSGEILKPYLIKEISGESLAKTLPIVFAERVTDFISMIILASLGLFVFSYGESFIIITSIFFFILIVVISQRKLSLNLLNYFGNFKFLNKYSEKLKISYENSYLMIRLIPLTLMTMLSVISWLFEAYSFYLILKEFSSNISIVWSIFVYSFSTIAGALSFLPGGLGVTEGSLTYLIRNNGLSLNAAVLSTFIIRCVTLWFAVVIGAFSLIFFQKRITKHNKTSVNDN